MQKRFRSLNAFKVAFIAPREASRSTFTLSFPVHCQKIFFCLLTSTSA